MKRTPQNQLRLACDLLTKLTVCSRWNYGCSTDIPAISFAVAWAPQQACGVTHISVDLPKLVGMPRQITDARSLIISQHPSQDVCADPFIRHL